MTFHSSGDIISQILEIRNNKSKHFSFRRLISMTTGGLFYGACGHTFYKFIDRRFPGRSWSSVKYKLIADALTCPPIATTGFIIVGSVEGKTWDQVVDNLRHNLAYIMVFDTVFYLPVQVLNFRFINPRFRYVFIASTSLLYSTVLSYFLHQK